MSRSYRKSKDIYADFLRKYEHPRSEDDLDLWIFRMTPGKKYGAVKAKVDYWQLSAPKSFRKSLNRILRAKQKVAVHQAMMSIDDNVIIPGFVKNADWLYF